MDLSLKRPLFSQTLTMSGKFVLCIKKSLLIVCLVVPFIKMSFELLVALLSINPRLPLVSMIGKNI